MPDHEDIRREIAKLCEGFGDAYWREQDRARAYPEAFVAALTEAGYLSALIPEEFGG
ncbi:MAG: acyl-CoA dehydrogenase family protein, partial [Pseudomonadota bacterium]